ncbi:MAG: hypothetical protein JWP89_5665 [Schlesneria sp.]|nr:hypothetical protein [Schlesneria sp.]
MKHTCFLLCIISFIIIEAESSRSSAADPSPRILTRLIFQDDDAKTLKWADLLVGDPPQLGPIAQVHGFPRLDTKHQSLVQMEAASGLVLVGVRDDEDGQLQSGWILIDTGVDADEHGDHSHWSYPRTPTVRAQVLDKQQGNPAHLYVYDGMFYLANDKKNGFTRLDPSGISAKDDTATIQKRAAFHSGGGGHITLAAVGNSVAYSSWIDREGVNQGRVDVTAISPAGAGKPSYSFHLPYGGIHGAAANQGKIFFAPSDGICWVKADLVLQADPKNIAIQHLSLGKDGDRPRRTGAFATYGKHVAFVAGSGPKAEVAFVDASEKVIQMNRITVPMAEGNRPSGLEIVRPRNGMPLVFVFHDHTADVEAPYRLSLLESDPDGDGNWNDAKIATEIDVGRARVDGHAGHHSLAFDADRRLAVFSNPGDGTISLLDLDARKIITQFHVSGVPSKLIATGGRASGH